MNRKYCEITKCPFRNAYAGKSYCKALNKTIGNTNLSKEDAIQCSLARVDLHILDNEIIQELTKERYRGPFKKYIFGLVDKFNKFKLKLRRSREYKKEIKRKQKLHDYIANMSDEERAAIKDQQASMVAKTIKEKSGIKSD